MLVLALDTSSAAVTAGVVSVDDGGAELLTERVTLNARGHGEHLAPGIAACLDEIGAAPRDLAAIVAGTGPGPFTGLRVGLVTAAVMGEVLAIPTYGVCSLDAIAAAAYDRRALLVATDARRKEVYWARYDADGRRAAGPEVSRPAELATDGVAAMSGAGARLYVDQLGLELIDVDHPSARCLVGWAIERIRSGAPTETLTPLYLRRPDAVAPHAPKTVSQ